MTGRKHDATGRSTGDLRGRRGRSNKVPKDQGNWMAITRDMIESPAWRALSVNARKALDRLMLEHLAHAGHENGNLICTYENFAAYGVTRRFISAAIRELVFFGWIRITHGETCSEVRPPNIYRLTWKPSTEFPATNEWKGITEEHVKAWKAKRQADSKNKPPPPESNDSHPTKGVQENVITADFRR